MIGSEFLGGDTAGVAVMVTTLLMALGTLLVDWRPSGARRRRETEMAAARASHPSAGRPARPPARFAVTPPPLTRMRPVVVRAGHRQAVRRERRAGA